MQATIKLLLYWLVLTANCLIVTTNANEYQEVDKSVYILDKKDYKRYLGIIKAGKKLYFKRQSSFVLLKQDEAVANFAKFIPPRKTFAVFFDFDNTLKFVDIINSNSRHTAIKLRGGNDKQQIKILEDIKKSAFCQGFYLVTAGVKTKLLLETIILTELNKLEIASLFKSAVTVEQQQNKLADATARLGNLIATIDKAEAINQVLADDFSTENRPEYIIFIDDNYDNAVKVFLSQALIEENTAEKYNFANTDVISIYYQSAQKTETEHFKPIFEPINHALQQAKQQTAIFKI